jgi:NitT/TauT family transport system substrate-binding protein
MTIIRRRALLAAISTTVFALVVACGGSEAPTTSSSGAEEGARLTETVKLTYLYSPSLTSAPAYVAAAKGYFKDENLDVKMEPFTGDSATVIPLLATGKADAIGISPNPALFNGIVNKIGVKFVLAAGKPLPGTPTAAYIVKTNGAVKTVADLKGKKVALVGGAATASGYYLSELLKQGNMTINDVEVVNLDFASGLAALDNGAVSAAIQQQPSIQREINTGNYAILGNMDTVYANGSGSGVLMGPTLLNTNRQAGAAFIRALQRASATDLQGDYLQNPDIAKIIADATSATVKDTQTIPAPKWDPTLKIDATIYDGMQKFWLTLGALTYKAPIKSSDVIDQELVDIAIKTKTK